MHPCVPHYTLPNSSHSLNPRSVSLRALPNSTRSLSLRMASLHVLYHSTHCLTDTPDYVRPLSTRCLTLRASYVTQHTVSFDTLLHSTFSHSTRCLAPRVLSTNSIIAVDKYWNTENNFIRQRLLCEHCSQVLVCCVSTLVECWSVYKHSN